MEVKKRQIFQYGELNDRRSDYGDLCIWNRLGLCSNYRSPGEKCSIHIFSPENIKIYNPDFMSPLNKPFHDVVTLVRTTICPIRFLNNKNFHSAHVRIMHYDQYLPESHQPGFANDRAWYY